MRTAPLPQETTSPFVPTLAAARAQGVSLPAAEPIEQDRWAALIVLTTFLRRTSWKEEMFGKAEAVAHLPRTAPPAPSLFERGSHLMVEDIRIYGACRDCTATPGLRTCRICQGKGVVQPPGARLQVVCSCKGAAIPCPTCRGQGTTNSITLRYYQDEPHHLRELLIPSHLPGFPPLFTLERRMEETLDVHVDPPEDLRCHDLTGRTAGTAYRGGERLTRPTFLGHDFGDTIDRTLASFKGLAAGGQILRYDVRAYAWPILRLRFPAAPPTNKPRDLALFVDRAHRLHKVGD